MKQIKKTIGILLAVCFIMSVTAAAVSAAVPSATGAWRNPAYYQ